MTARPRLEWADGEPTRAGRYVVDVAVEFSSAGPFDGAGLARGVPRIVRHARLAAHVRPAADAAPTPQASVAGHLAGVGDEP